MEGAYGRGEGAHDDAHKDMDEDQLNWWKETKAEIMKRKKLLRSLSSTPRGDGGDTVA